MTKKPLYLVIGKGGVGKDYFVDGVCAVYNMEKVISYTSRPPRHPEEATHKFVDQDWFMEHMKDMPVSTVFADEFYGATKEQIDAADIYIVDPPGALMALENLKDREIKIIAVIAPFIERVERMLSRCNMDERDLQTRLEMDFQDFGADEYESGYLVYGNTNCPVDYYVYNDDDYIVDLIGDLVKAQSLENFLHNNKYVYAVPKMADTENPFLSDNG